MLIPNITQRLRELTTLLTTTDIIGANQAYTIASFFRDFGETNNIISEAIEMAETDAEKLQANICSLMATINDYDNTDRTNLQNADFKAIVDAHINTFEAPQKAAQQRATDLRHAHRDLSNRLDWIADVDSEEYKKLDAECDKAKAAYDEASAENVTLYNRCRAEKTKFAFVYYFEPEYIDILVVKLRQICESILTDIQHGKEAAHE